ncbi:lethal(3)malignant brain tumor-like protein 4 isoform X2 [Acanthochromis polyacanthus]|uniref:lethal(3)malignant brain tumor-like protein 4 isoform X2 n=1 Tax=Acanthochromis polyacanthus TaxID=80966 RepID=UPI002234469E|nr:lethal(3)malignant brain tumor-like protein 4 isoform X2 [Acanthochromis polyacanthus]
MLLCPPCSPVSLQSVYTCLSVRLSVCPPVCLSTSLSVHLSVCPPVCLSTCLSVCPPVCLSTSLSVCPPVCLSVHLSVCPPVCLSTSLSVCPPVCLSTCLSVCLSVHLSVCPPVCLSVRLSVCPPVCLSVRLSVCPPVCLSTSLSVCPPVCLSTCLSVCPPVCLSVHLSVCPPVCLSVHLSVCPPVCPPVCLSTCLTANSLHLSVSQGCGFRVGMKLEAVDRKNPGLVCVASVADVIEDRFLVHFDNWDDTYDYWCDSSSPYIHPVGWCEEQGRPLTAPQGHPNPEGFVWEEYLQETGSTAAPSSAFTLREPHGFQVNHRLEAVDRRNPMLVRVATITDREDYRVKVHYDGWSTQFDIWCDSDLPDLHPVGWCQRSGHPLEPPPGSSPLSSPSQGVCPTAGCRGVGHIKGAKYTGHHSAFGCPYSDINMRKEVVLPDRLGGERVVTLVPVAMHYHGNQSDRRGVEVKMEPQDQTLLLPLGKRRRLTDRLSQPTKFLCVKQEDEELPVRALGPEPGLQAALHQSVFLSALSAQPGRDLSLCWEQHRKLLPAVAGVHAHSVQHWSVQQVSDFIESLPGCEEQAKQFRDEQIDGRAFLLLTQRDIVRIMSIKLGPALKIYNSILMFKHAKDGSQSHGEDGSQSHGEDGSQSHGEDGSQSHGEDGSQSHGEDGSQSHGEDGNQSHGKDT